ncbi:MAG: GNAT family N-acetyltransferase [Cyanobacteriota bacterium]|nr:GNAT family N-acetyltransferase [Cyanobacteriota bacterium]
MKIRLACEDDAHRLVRLSAQLGYPATVSQMQQRLKTLLHHEDHAIYVAAIGKEVVGWVHVHRCALAIAPTLALIFALAVDENYRRRAIGRKLVEQIEQWARDKGCHSVLVRSNIIRQDAHGFYQHLGYVNIKQSMVFPKSL